MGVLVWKSECGYFNNNLQWVFFLNESKRKYFFDMDIFVHYGPMHIFVLMHKGQTRAEIMNEWTVKV